MKTMDIRMSMRGNSSGGSLNPFRNRHSLNANMHAALLATPPATVEVSPVAEAEESKKEEEQEERTVPMPTQLCAPPPELQLAQQQAALEFRHIFRLLEHAQQHQQMKAEEQ